MKRAASTAAPSRRWAAALTAVTVVAAAVATGFVAMPPAAHAANVATIDLGDAATFAVLTGAAVGNTASGPVTMLRGDLGAGGGTTGFPPGLYTGTLYTGAATGPALADLDTAYADALGRPAGTPLAGDLIAKTVGPGVHTNAGAVANTGTFTIDAGGDSNAVFIFQIGGALAMAASSHVVLANGARAANVFWQVNGAAAIGATATFAGTVMATAAIGVGDGTIFNGRALSQTGAVSLTSDQFYSSAPTVSINPGATAYTTDTSPTITGATTVRAPSTVTVTVHGETLTPIPLADGTWSATPVGLLVNGDYQVTASVIDGALNTGSFTQQLTVDTTPPVVTIDGAATLTTNDLTPTISGSTDVAPGQLVTLTVIRTTPALTFIRTTLVQSDGTWNITPNGFSAGVWTITAAIADPAGNQTTATHTLVIDVSAPVATITGGANALTNNPAPTILGTAVNATVTVSVDGQALPNVDQTADNWSAPFTFAPLGSGTHHVAMTATDAAGNITTVEQTLTVDTVLPLITINPGATDATNDRTPTISGTTDVASGPGVTVSVLISGQSPMTALVQAGEWNVTPSVLLASGTYTVTATVLDPAGNVGTSTQTLTIDVAAPVVTIDGGLSRTTSDATPSIAGASGDVPVGSTVTVTVAGQTLPTTIGVGGGWTVVASTIANGTYVVFVTLVDAAGNSGNANQSLTVNAVAPVVTFTNGAVASTNDDTPLISGSTDASTGSAVTVAVGAQTLHSTVQPGGSWNVTAAHLNNAVVTVVASVTDDAGNIGTAVQTLTVGSTTPTTITIAGGLATSTSDDTPTIAGTTDAADGRFIIVTIDGQTMSGAVVFGQWSVDATHLDDGTYTIEAHVSSAGGNPGSSSQTLTIDTVAPVVVLQGGSAVETTDSTPTIHGSGATPGSTVTVTVAGQTMTTTVGADGTWSVTPTAPLPAGSNPVVVTIIDPAGNSGTATQVIVVVALPVAVPPPGTTPTGTTPTDPSDGVGFSSMTPKRVFDTRIGQSPNTLRAVAKQQVSGDHELQVTMTDLAGYVPATGVGAVSLNVTSTGSNAAGFITVYACGTRELVSSVNFPAGGTVANAVVAPVSANGTVCFYANVPTDIVVDINGWFAVGATFTAIGPKRVLDTRPGNSPDVLRTITKAKINADTEIAAQLTDLGGYVPATGVDSVSLNVVVTNPEADGFVTVYSCATRALVSSVNFVAGQTVANAVIGSVSASGTVCFYTSATVDLIVDINGWVRGGSGFTGLNPARVLDTRLGESPNALRDIAKTKIGGGHILEVRVTDLAGLVPANGVTAVSLNVTATNPEADGFITVFACGVLEEVSSVNFLAGQTVANAVLARVSAAGTICLYANTPTDVIVDINAWVGAPQVG